MSHCNNCHGKLKEGAQFCANCGQPVPSSPAAEERKVPAQEVSRSGHKESIASSSSKGKRNFINVKTVSAFIIIILLIGTYYFMGRMFAPEAVADSFIEAVDVKDVKKVKEYINKGQMELEATDAETEAFVEYLDKHPKVFSELAASLKATSQDYRKSEDPTTVSINSNEIGSLKWEGKKWGLFNNYIIEIQPYYTNVTTTFDDTEVFIDNKKIGIVNQSKEETFGPFLPGEHQIKAVIDGEYGKVEEAREFDGSDMEDRTVSIGFDWSDRFIDVYTDNEDATLFVNGKSTGKKLEDMDEIGPVSFDGSLKLHAEKKFGDATKKTESVTVQKDTSTVELLFNYNQDESIESENASAELSEIDGNDDDESIIKETINYHYGSITNDDFEQAYDVFSSERKSTMTLEQWSKGLKENRSDDVNVVNVTEVNGSTAIAYVEMTSYDDTEDGDTLVQEWGGDWHLVKEDGRWVLDKAKLKKLNSRTE